MYLSLLQILHVISILIDILAIAECYEGYVCIMTALWGHDCCPPARISNRLDTLLHFRTVFLAFFGLRAEGRLHRTYLTILFVEKILVERLESSARPVFSIG